MKIWNGLATAALLALAGCTSIPATGWPLQGTAANPETLGEKTTAGLCRDWQRALDGYEVSRIRREIAGELSARGENPETCALRAGLPPERRAAAGKIARPARASVRPASTGSQTARRPAIRANAGGSLTCTSELVKGPPDRYKTVCR